MCVYDNPLKGLILAHSFSERTKFQGNSWSEISRQAKINVVHIYWAVNATYCILCAK